MSTSFHTPIDLERDEFMRQLITSLGHLNETILGSDVAGAYIMNVGLSMGAAIEQSYKRFWQIDRPFTLDEYTHVIIDLKQKIHGNFSLVSQDPTRVVVRTTSCPFDTLVHRSPSLCFMTSSVFGGIAARNFGYAKVILQKRIALGDDGCYVIVHLTPSPEAKQAIGREYFAEQTQASPDIAGQLNLMDRVGELRRALGESSSRWEEIVNGAADAICLIDRVQVVRFANARWRELLGVEGEELVGNLITSTLRPEAEGEAEATLARVLLGERKSGLNWSLRHRDGTGREAMVSAGPIRDEQGRILGALLILRDITEERQLQRLKDEFIATASHELRTPATTIAGMSAMLLRTIEQGRELSPERLKERLQLIEQEASRLATLSVELLDVGRLQYGALHLQRDPHDLNEIVQGVMSQPRFAPMERIEVELSPTPLPLSVERSLIERLLGNLLDNALKYSPEGGAIVVRTLREGAWAKLVVIDQGIGVPAEDLAQLSQPFYRATNVSAHHYPGLGLGLYLSQQIARAHDGGLKVESVEGQGSQITVILPLVETINELTPTD